MRTSLCALLALRGATWVIKWWVGWVEEVPGVNAQEASREELLESLREVLREALEFNRKDALEAAGPGAEELALIL